jgi:signal transduction histidine kinase
MSLINPTDSLEKQNEKLLEITDALMRRVEQDTDRDGLAYIQFERAALLEDQVRQRTLDLEHTLGLLSDSNDQLAAANTETERARADLADAIEAVNEGFALFDARDKLVLTNSRFCEQIFDVMADLRPGISFDDYVRLVSGSRYLELPTTESRADWVANRLRYHREPSATLNVRLTGDRWLQISEHRTANDGTVVLQTDISAIMRLEREERTRLIDRQAKMIRATLDHLTQGVCIFDQRTRLVGWNRRVRALLNLSHDTLRIGARFDRLVDELQTEIAFDRPETPSELREWVRRQSGRPPLTFEVGQGETQTLAVMCQEMPDHGFVISFTDVSNERAAARALANANEMLERRVLERTLELEDAVAAAERANASKTRFVAAASHDLLQPLSAAKLYVASLSGPQTPPSDREIVAKAQSALSSVEQIIDSLLDISRLDSGRAQFDVAAVPLNDVLGPLRSEMVPLAQEKGLDLRVVPNSASVTTDATFLRRILRNLISNAIRYTHSGKIVVGARRRGDGTLRLEVWDTGPGIPEDDQDIIFQEFTRLDTRASASEGLGLGLAIVERACLQLGHPLGLSSRVGVGTGFFISVPRAPSGNTPQRTVQHPIPARLRASGLIVLLVDNDLEFRRALTLLMEKWGVSVLDVGTAEEALNLLSEIQIAPDAALLDQHLGTGMSGTALLDVLRDRYGPAPAAILSADRSVELQAHCTERGVDLISKPVDPMALNALLNKIPASPST